MKCYCLIKEDVMDRGWEVDRAYTVIAVYMDSAKAKEKADELNRKEREKWVCDDDDPYYDNDLSGTYYSVCLAHIIP